MVARHAPVTAAEVALGLHAMLAIQASSPPVDDTSSPFAVASRAT